MLTDKEGVHAEKYVCPDCHGDNIGESGLGGDMLHCFGVCMRDIPKKDCLVAPVSSDAELWALKQEPY